LLLNLLRISKKGLVMRKTYWILASTLVIFAGFAHATSTPHGQSTLKLSQDDEDTLRATRKALESVDKDIASLDQEIQQARVQSLTSRSMPAANPMQAASYDALVNSIELQKTELLARRASLRTDLQYLSN
jgi:hypothetical protein